MELNEVVCSDGGTLKECWKQDGTQVNLRTVPVHTTVGGHRHPKTNEWFWFLRGSFRVYLEGSDPFVVFPTTLVKVPAGTGHRVENIGENVGLFVFFLDREYDPEDYEEWT